MKPRLRLWAWVRWHAGRLAALLGLPGCAALVVVVTIGAAQWVALPDVRSRAAALREASAQLAQASDPQPQASPHAARQAQRRQRFASLMPSSTAASMDALARLHAVAQGLQLPLEVGSYRTEQAEDEPIVRMEIVVQGRGSYGQLRSFALRALQDPALALNTVRWDRQGTADASLGGEFQFTLYMRAP